MQMNKLPLRNLTKGNRYEFSSLKELYNAFKLSFTETNITSKKGDILP